MSASAVETGKKPYYGVAEAIVIGVNDPEEEGRIQVEFPWFDGDMTTEWCRVCQFYAGNQYGAFWVPEEGDEVLVAFVHGDMRIPVILGGLYNGQDKPPSHRADDLDEKVIKTKAGHMIVFDDHDTHPRISIIDKSGDNSIIIDTQNNEITIEAAQGTLKLVGKNGVSIESDVEIKLDAKSGTMGLNASTIDIN